MICAFWTKGISGGLFPPTLFVAWMGLSAGFYHELRHCMKTKWELIKQLVRVGLVYGVERRPHDIHEENQLLFDP